MTKTTQLITLSGVVCQDKGLDMYSKWAKGIIVSVMFAVSCTAVAATTVVSHSDEYQHDASAGGKGQDSIRLPAPPVAAGQCALFQDAELVFSKRRYGTASIVVKPAAGCNPAVSQCKLEVKWEHAPAGRLNYKVKIDWAIGSGC